MKAGKKSTNPFSEMTGKVTRKKFGGGTKSEHDAVYLETDSGSYVLRRIGANPFQDPGLAQYIGKKVKVTGIIEQYVLMIKEINEL